MESVANIVSRWWSPIVAVIALLQPWIIAAWKKYIRVGSVDIHDFGKIEVGYSGIGPSIAVFGTLRAVDRDQFVDSIRLEVVREKDGSTRTFNWFVFRKQSVSIGAQAQNQTSAELPAAFTVTAASAHTFNIVFNDTAFVAELTPAGARFQHAWETFTWENGGRQMFESGAEPGAPATQQRLEPLYKRFATNAEHVDAYTAIDRAFNWVAGRYTLKVVVATAGPKRTFSTEMDFELQPEDIKNLRLNTVTILRELCGRPIGMYNFAYPLARRRDGQRARAKANAG